MKKLLGLFIILIASTALLSSWLQAQPPGGGFGGVRITTMLTGGAEAPGPGDADAVGVASLVLSTGKEKIYYELAVANIAPATAAHIHAAVAGVPGPVVVALSPPTSGWVSGTVSVSRELIQDISHHPENYYINVHNADYPAGAARGQLSR